MEKRWRFYAPAPNKANVVVNSDGDMQATVAHEVAHIYGVGDEYDQVGSFRLSVNSPPYGYWGCD